jgi:uncharacterized membrane protein YczE
MVLKNWIDFIKRLPTLFFGLFLFAVGLLANLYSGLGMNPWGVLNLGIVNHTPLTYGQASQIIGLVVLLIGWGLGYPPGFGTFMNMYIIGLFIDLINSWGIFPIPGNILERYLMLFFSVLILGVASFLYLKVQLGAGPRDGLMMGLVKTLDQPLSLVRSGLEVLICSLGYLLGAPVGIGTLITAITIGYSVQMAFKLGRFDSRSEQMNIYQLAKLLTNTA